jgi:hypothetical protein
VRGWHRRLSWEMATVLCLLFPAHLAGAHSPEAVQFAQVSLDRLTVEQRRELSMHLGYLAHFDARLENCGFHSHVEQRSIAAVSPCIRPDSLAPLRAFFRQQKAATFKLIAESQNGPENQRVDCSKQSERAWLDTLKPIIGNHIRELDRMCRACTFCRTSDSSR